MFVEYNPNPEQHIIGDCVIRAIAKLMDTDWDTAFVGLAVQAYKNKKMMEDNSVWGEYLKEHGYKRHTLPDTCPDCYTVAEFCRDFPSDTYLLATGTHAVTVVNGDYYDTWDSAGETPLYYYVKEDASNGVPE